MNIEEYIASGILENYILGNCSSQEQQEVECMSHIYPEIREELTNLEVSMESFFMEQQVAPPVDLWDAIAQEIDDEPMMAQTSASINENEADSAVIPQKKTTRIAPVISLISAVAAVFLGILYLNTTKKIDTISDELSTLSAQNASMNDSLSRTVAALEFKSSLLTFVTDPASKSIYLKGIPGKYPEGNVLVAWNPTDNKVILNKGNLPQNPPDKQYQLWAIVDGTPVDLGVFDMGDQETLLEMKPVSGAAAFAITLEERGGKPTPNLEELYVLGEVG